MPNLHPRTLAALAAGPQEWWNKDGTIVTKQESPTDFALRIAQIAMEEGREECAVAAWNHFMETCKRLKVSPGDMDAWGAASAIRRGKP